MRSASETPRNLRSVAGRQWGVVTRKQLEEVRVSDGTIERRVESGAWRRMHRAVYFVRDGEPSLRANAFAALAALGDEAMLSDRTAAELDRLLDPRPGPIHVTANTKHRLDGVIIHRRQIPISQVTKGQVLRRTTTVRTILDLAATADEATVRRALNEACHLGIVDLDELRGLTETVRRGKRILQRALNDAARTTNHLEDRFYAILRAAKLPPPIGQYRIGPYIPDFYWPDHKLIVETDGWAGHGHSFARLRDRRRDAYFKGRNIHTHRVPRRQLEGNPFHMVAELAVEIASRAG